MRVLFYADLKHGQAEAVWRCRREFEALGIELIHTEGGEPPDHDLILAHTVNDYWMTFLNPRKTNAPVVALERIDGAQLSAPIRQNIGNPRLKAVIKNTVYENWARYNEKCWRGHEHTCRVAMHGIRPEENVPEMLPLNQWITPEQYRKLRVGFSFAAYPHYDALRRVDFSDDRPYSVHFAGTVDYGEQMGWLNWHRGQALSAAQKIPNAFVIGGRELSFADYFKTLKQSRFVVSPWGLGEPCYRDFEAVLCGCMVIKPYSKGIITLPARFYELPHFSRCICRPDYADLADIVGSAEELSVGDKLAWAQYVLEQNSTPVIARRLAAIFHEAAS